MAIPCEALINYKQYKNKNRDDNSGNMERY